MARFVRGDVVILPFPFSDLSGSKRRPALVLCDLPGNDIILCQITSQNGSDPHALVLNQADFVSGSLPVVSYIRPARIFTADKNIIIQKRGTINPTLIARVSNILTKLLT